MTTADLLPLPPMQRIDPTPFGFMTFAAQGYTADQMHAFALAHRLAERERCAKLVERMYGWPKGSDIAAAIREGS
jgi:hypothetical protein